MELLTLGLFCSLLLICLVLDLSIIYALLAGLLLFFLYGRKRGFSWGALAAMALDGVKTVRNILITFLLIGMLTALWRAAGTIPVIVCYAAQLIRPPVFLVMTFLLNSGVSMLTGTSFGTAATMGVICATMGSAMNVDMTLVGGAVLSGAFFGDRCSPVSTSLLLVSELTGTSIFDNLRRLFKDALLPFFATCAIYAVLGLLSSHSGELLDLNALFSTGFVLHWTALLPAAAVLLLSSLRVNVKRTMAVSILTALPVCLLVQHHTIGNTLRFMFTGYHTDIPQLAAMVNGGGITSMIKVGAIVCLSSSYSGIFRKTGLLDSAKQTIAALAHRTTPFIATLCTSLVSGMIACNQTLAIILTHQLCGDLEEDPGTFALFLADSAVIIAPLIPWSIAGAVPLASIGADASSLPLAFYLYLVPLWQTAKSLWKTYSHKKRPC